MAAGGHQCHARDTGSLHRGWCAWRTLRERWSAEFALRKERWAEPTLRYFFAPALPLPPGTKVTRACQYLIGKPSLRLQNALIRLRKNVTMRDAGKLIEPEDFARDKAHGSVSSQPERKSN